jgi:NADH-quinone oxidoreductase subunit M
MIPLFIIPFIAALIVLLMPSKRLALLLSLLPLAQLLSSPIQEVNLNWLPTLGIQFHLKADPLALVFLYLTAVIIPVTLLQKKPPLPNLFYGLVLLLQGLLIGFFTSQNLFLFLLFFEAMLLPLYFIIGYWGKEKRKVAALTFLLYMIAGSVLMIAAILSLYFLGPNTFELDALASATLPYAPWICAIFLLAFAVKTPLFPFHGWLPDTYYEASTAGTILLSALLSKAGIYGILRICLPLFPSVMQAWSPWLLALAIAGVFYGGLAAWWQNDYKRLIAYSSLSHVNFILAGLFVWSETAHSGAILQSVNHGVTIAALFLAAGWLESRIGTTRMEGIGGLAKYTPMLCWFTLFFVLASVAVPGTNNFVGELMILFGLFVQRPYVGAFLTLTVILSVIYMLRWMRLVYFGPPIEQPAYDLQSKEKLIALVLAAIILWIGIYPTPVLKLTKTAAEKIGGTA